MDGGAPIDRTRTLTAGTSGGPGFRETVERERRGKFKEWVVETTRAIHDGPQNLGFEWRAWIFHLEPTSLYRFLGLSSFHPAFPFFPAVIRPVKSVNTLSIDVEREFHDIARSHRGFSPYPYLRFRTVGSKLPSREISECWGKMRILRTIQPRGDMFYR